MKYKLFTMLFASIALVAAGTIPVSAVLDPGTGGQDPTVNNCPDNQGDCAKTTSFAFGTCGDANVSIRCLFVEVFKFLSAAVGIAVVAGIATGGIMYSTAQGNPSKTQKGMTIIINSVIGLVLYLLMFALINFLVPGGVFT